MSCTCSLWPMEFLFFSPLSPFGKMRQFLLDSLAENIFSTAQKCGHCENHCIVPLNRDPPP